MDAMQVARFKGMRKGMRQAAVNPGMLAPWMYFAGAAVVMLAGFLLRIA